MNNVYGLLFFVFSLPHFSCGNSTQTTSPKTAKVVESVYASGIVKSENQYEVFSKSPGVVAHIFLRKAIRFLKGRPFFRLKTRILHFLPKMPALFPMQTTISATKKSAWKQKTTLTLLKKNCTTIL
jgi:hypothetical protein